MAANKIDLRKTHAKEYAASLQPALVEIGQAQYVCIPGQGDPSGAAYAAALAALYAVAYGIKMPYKKATGTDYAVGMLEGLWWGDVSSTAEFIKLPRSAWRWKMLIRTPEFIAQQHLNEAVASALRKGKGDAVERVTLETLHEGACAQLLHVGSYISEADHSIPALHAFIDSQGLRFNGLHHEIYLSDPRKVAPEKLKTILRQPVRRS
jgi:hypothetical protein